jgi:hypothetical protein
MPHSIGRRRIGIPGTGRTSCYASRRAGQSSLKNESASDSNLLLVTRDPCWPAMRNPYLLRAGWRMHFLASFRKTPSRRSLLWARFGEPTLKAPHAIQWLSDNGPQQRLKRQGRRPERRARRRDPSRDQQGHHQGPRVVGRDGRPMMHPQFLGLMVDPKDAPSTGFV